MNEPAIGTALNLLLPNIPSVHPFNHYGSFHL